MRESWLPWVRVLLFAAVPAIAIGIAARQAYLSAWYGLSTWKGGGMGMFAGADSRANRFTRIYVELPDGRRQPVITMTSGVDWLIGRALWYPNRANFKQLAQSLRRTTFIAVDPASTTGEDASGAPSGSPGRACHLVRADEAGPDGSAANWKLAIEYWTIDYDPETRLAQASIADTMRFDWEAN